jgi:hypothetical protein
VNRRLGLIEWLMDWLSRRMSVKPTTTKMIIMAIFILVLCLGVGMLFRAIHDNGVQTRRDNRELLASLGFPMDQVEVSNDYAMVPLGNCRIKVEFNDGQISVRPLDQDPEIVDVAPPAVGYDYQRLLAEAPSLGYGYCIQG